jgi:hypothetical protein
MTRATRVRKLNSPGSVVVVSPGWVVVVSPGAVVEEVVVVPPPGTWQPLARMAAPAGQFRPGKNEPESKVKGGMMSPHLPSGPTAGKIGPV